MLQENIKTQHPIKIIKNHGSPLWFGAPSSSIKAPSKTTFYRLSCKWRIRTTEQSTYSWSVARSKALYTSLRVWSIESSTFFLMTISRPIDILLLLSRLFHLLESLNSLIGVRRQCRYGSKHVFMKLLLRLQGGFKLNIPSRKGGKGLVNIHYLLKEP